MRRSDVESVKGRGVVGWLRESTGCQSPEAQQSLKEWEQEAQRRWRWRRVFRLSAGERCGEWTKKSRR